MEQRAESRAESRTDGMTYSRAEQRAEQRVGQRAEGSQMFDYVILYYLIWSYIISYDHIFYCNIYFLVGESCARFPPRIWRSRPAKALSPIPICIAWVLACANDLRTSHIALKFCTFSYFWHHSLKGRHWCQRTRGAKCSIMLHCTLLYYLIWPYIISYYHRFYRTIFF